MSLQVSLIIATCNRARALARTLDCLERQDLPKTDWELIVAVDGSRDRTMELLDRARDSRSLPLTFFRQQNAGAAAARHAAIERTRARRIVVLDDDMRVAPDFLRRHLEAATPDPERTVVLGRILPIRSAAAKPIVAAVQEADLEKLHRAYEEGRSRPSWDGFFTGNVSFPRALYFEVGGFDRTFTKSEDIELGYRLAKAGAVFVHGVQASSEHDSDVAKYHIWARRQFDYGAADLRLWEKHGRAHDAHPMRHLQRGSLIKRVGVLALVPCDAIAAAAVWTLGCAGSGLQHLRMTPPAIAAYRAIRVLQYHRGMRAAMGSVKTFHRLRRAYVDNRERTP